VRDGQPTLSSSKRIKARGNDQGATLFSKDGPVHSEWHQWLDTGVGAEIVKGEKCFDIPNPRTPRSQITTDFAMVASKLSCPTRRSMLPDRKRCKQRRTLLVFGLGTPILVLLVGSLCSIASADSAAHIPTQVSLTWRNILTLAATTGFLTALLNHGVSFFTDIVKIRRAAKQQARSLALKLIEKLETFATACSQDLARTHYDSEVSGKEFLPKQFPSLPPLRELGENKEWAAIDRRLSTSAATMNYERDLASQSVKIAVELLHREHEETYVFDTFYQQVTNIGLKAALLAQKLRRKYGSPATAGDSIIDTISALVEERANIARGKLSGDGATDL
jgi:hypothetical protein